MCTFFCTAKLISTFQLMLLNLVEGFMSNIREELLIFIIHERHTIYCSIRSEVGLKYYENVALMLFSRFFAER